MPQIGHEARSSHHSLRRAVDGPDERAIDYGARGRSDIRLDVATTSAHDEPLKRLAVAADDRADISPVEPLDRIGHQGGSLVRSELCETHGRRPGDTEGAQSASAVAIDVPPCVPPRPMPHDPPPQPRGGALRVEETVHLRLALRQGTRRTWAGPGLVSQMDEQRKAVERELVQFTERGLEVARMGHVGGIRWMSEIVHGHLAVTSVSRRAV
jgi:hypothetical protein